MEEFGQAPPFHTTEHLAIASYVRPRWALLLIATVLAAGGVAFVPARSSTFHLVGYLCSVLGLTGLVIFRFANRSRQTRPNYLADPRAGYVSVVIFVASVGSLVIHALRIAQKVPR